MLSFKRHKKATLLVYPHVTNSQARDINKLFGGFKVSLSLSDRIQTDRDAKSKKCVLRIHNNMLQCMPGKVNIRTAWHLVTPTKLMKTLMPYNLLNRPTCPTQTIHTSFII